jgi:hypothetical protein
MEITARFQYTGYFIDAKVQNKMEKAIFVVLVQHPSSKKGIFCVSPPGVKRNSRKSQTFVMSCLITHTLDSKP